MTRRDKRIERLRNNSRDVRPDELERLLLMAGFEMRNGKGDHRRYTRGAKKVTLDFGQSPVHSHYLKDVLKLLEED